MTPDKIKKALDDLVVAMQSYQSAQAVERDAISAAAAAMNALNDAQKRVDAAFAEVKAAAPARSDWRSASRALGIAVSNPSEKYP